MSSKVPKAQRDHAYKLLREGRSIQEAADLSGVSLRTVGRYESLLSGKSAMPARSARAPQGSPPREEASPDGLDADSRTTLDFEESPAPVEPKSLVDSALSSLKGMLGISEGEAKPKKAPTPLSGKLGAKQQAFVEAASPTLALAVIAIAAWMWGHQGTEFAILAPDEEVATRIVTPLLRVYARHASFLTDISPDMADVGASLLALVGYVHVSLGLYQQIKQQEQDYEYDQEQESRGDATRRRAYRAAKSESGARDTGGGYAPVSRTNGAGDPRDGEHDGRASGVNQLNLSDKEARQYAALSRLAALDYEHRARRSGQPR